MNKKFPLVVFTRHVEKNKPSLIHTPKTIHTLKAQSKAIDEAAKTQSVETEMKTLLEASKIIRKAVDEYKMNPWIFSGSINIF